MRRYTMLAAVCALFVLLFATPAYTQTFPNQCGTTQPVLGQVIGTGPLGALPAGSVWGFVLHGETAPFPIGLTSILNAPVGVTGSFQVSTGAARGGTTIVGQVLTKLTISANGAAVTVNEIVSGSYQVDLDCTGGYIMLGNGNQVGLSLHIDGILTNTGFSDFRFDFAGADRTKMYLVSADNRGTTLTGEAIRVNPAP